MADFKTTSVTVGDATEKVDIDVLADNNTRLLQFLRVQHKFHGAGIRGGRHFGLAKYFGNGTATAGAAEANMVSVVSAADFTATGNMWEAVVVMADFTAVWHWSGNEPTYTEYAAYQAGDFSGHVYRSGGTVLKYATSAPADDYVKFFTDGATVTLAIKPAAASNRAWAYAIWRIF